MNILWHSKHAFFHTKLTRNFNTLRLTYLVKYLGIYILHRQIAAHLIINPIADSQLRRLQSVRNAAARWITGTWHMEHITPVLQSLHWLPVRQRILFKLAVLVHKCLNGRAPTYLTDDCCLTRHRRYGLRSSSSTTKLEVPHRAELRLATDLLPSAAHMCGTVYWLPFVTHHCHSLSSKTHLFGQWPWRLWFGMDAFKFPN